MGDDENNLEAGLMPQSAAENQTQAYVYIITKIFPLLATGVFASTTDVKKPESIALSAAFVLSTALPVLADAFKLIGRSQLTIETLSGFLMLAGVGMMDQGAIAENNQSTRSIIALIAVGCFSLFAAINLVYNALRLAGCIQDRKPGVELASSSFGVVGSLLFLAGNTLGYLAQKEAGKSTDVTLRMIAVASLFTLSTALHTLLAGRAVCAKKPEEGVSADDDVRFLENENRVTQHSPTLPPTPPVSPVTPVPGSNSPRGDQSRSDAFFRSDSSNDSLRDRLDNLPRL